MSIDLKVNLGGIEFKNPFIVAASDVGCYVEQVKEAEICGAGGFIIKTCLPRLGAAGLKRKPRYYFDRKNRMLRAVAGFRRISLDEAKKLVSDARKEVRIPIGASIAMGLPTEEEKDLILKAAIELSQSGATFLELNTSLNIPIHFGETQAKSSDEYFTNVISVKYPDFIQEVTRHVKNNVRMPVLVKIAIENINVDAFIAAAEKGNADAVDLMGAGPGLTFDIDINTPAKFGRVFKSADKAASFGLTGEPLRRIMQAYLIRCVKSRQIPVIGCGGIMNWKHAVETIMCGATATASCSIFMQSGFEVLKQMNNGLIGFMENQGYSSIDQFKGILVNNIALTLGDISVSDAVAKVEPQLCTGCGLCLKPAHCGRERKAISLINGKAIVEEAQCLGCETCVSICPKEAIDMILK